MPSQLGIPVKLLHETVGLIISLELKTGHSYRGRLIDLEDSMNCQLTDVTITGRDGSTRLAQTVYLRGSAIRMFVLPDNLRYAAVLTAERDRKGVKGLGMGRGRAEVQRVQAARGGLMMAPRGGGGVSATG